MKQFEDDLYFKVFMDLVRKHRNNPLVSQHLADLLMTVKLVEVDSLERIVGEQRIQDAARNQTLGAQMQALLNKYNGA